MDTVPLTRTTTVQDGAGRSCAAASDLIECDGIEMRAKATTRFLAIVISCWRLQALNEQHTVKYIISNLNCISSAQSVFVRDQHIVHVFYIL